MLTIQECWAFLESQLEDSSALPPGVKETEIDEAQAALGVAFPEDFRESLLCHDGSGKCEISPYKIGGGGQRLMRLEEIVALTKSMIELGADFESDGEFGEQTGPVKQNYWNNRWISFTDDSCGDCIFIDLDPPEDGKLGQVVDWWHECAASTYQSSSLREWLNEVVEEIKKGVYTFG